MNASVAFAVERPVYEEIKLCRSEELPKAREFYEKIARRAFELFEARNCKPGHDWEDWFRAEAELLRPVPVEMNEKAEAIVVRATVLGFDATELKVSVEPWRLIIVGQKEQFAEIGEKVFYVDWNPCEIYRVVRLPSAVNPEYATAKLHAGVLELMLPLSKKSAAAKPGEK